MTPVFKNCVVTENDIGEHMQEFLASQGEQYKPTKYLIGSMYAKDILLITPLARWYLEEGLIITKIEQLIQFEPKPCFKAFAESVSNDRRAGNTILII